MSSRRKRGNVAAEDGGPSSSQTKKYKPSRRVPLFWQWEGDKRKWIACGQSLSDAINDSLDSGENVKFEAVGKTLEVDVKKMVQRNCTTGWERRIRCCVKQKSEYFVWEWQDEKKRWNAYCPEHAIALENGWQNNDGAVSLNIASRNYTMDLNKMEQSNDDTQVVRQIRRDKTEHTESDSAVKILMAQSEEESQPRQSRNRMKPKLEVKEEMEEEEEEEAQASTSTAKPKTKSGRWNEGVKTVRISGNRPPVDPECEMMTSKAQVYMDGAGAAFDAMLNQTNLKNNNNKYYVIQLLEENARKWYHVWFRWGRVGHKGQNNLINCGTDLEKALSTFEQKFWDKTRNEWSARDNFVKVAGKYDLLKMDYTTKKENGDDIKENQEKSKVDSKLDAKIQALVSMICNVKAMEEMVIEMKYDTQKAPLGKLTVDQIKAGYLALKKIEKCIEGNIIGDRLIQACDEFYTRIPHNFGMQRPPVIRTKQEFKAKLMLLEALGDIQIALKVLETDKTSDEHPIDQQYHALKCKMEPLDKSSKTFELINKYVQNTHAVTHNQYAMTIDEVFDLDKQGESENFNDVGNKMLLWHGSRLTNWAGILGQGLRIAPPEAPVTGYMFGKGIYFADMSSKSANYCFATRTNPYGLLTLCEVALGQPNKLLAADYNADKLPSGKHSVMGLGRIAPEPKDNFTMENGTVVPTGKGVGTGVVNPNGYTLNYNEFVVYKTNQVRMKYLVKIKFNFK
ncbi:poly [ADP-ribose] polymerase 2-like isoform X1 [Diadema setosum]|uniref:poly [ADP-ribose] polymerase 2-like isoform X1 n=1 Tax=Diadema setosum TaxID=31175 RepID=UPI003B3ADC46